VQLTLWKRFSVLSGEYSPSLSYRVDSWISSGINPEPNYLKLMIREMAAMGRKGILRVN
jgi:hypothetical protein